MRIRNGSYVVEDLGSQNGTTVNGRPVVGTVQLRDGDRIGLADTEVEFQLLEEGHQPVNDRRQPPDATRRLAGQADSWSPAGGDDTTSHRHPLYQQLHDSPGLSARNLALAVAGSVVGTILTGAVGPGKWWNLFAAALTPIVAATFTTKRAGDTGWVRVTAIILLSAAALAITWTSVSLADRVAERPGTFPGPIANDEGSGHGSGQGTDGDVAEGRHIEVTTDLDCGTATVGARLPCPALEIRSTGDEPLHITGVEVFPDQTEFIPGLECVGVWLETDQTCEMTVQFAPSVGGERTATLVVHQNIPPPDRGTHVNLVGNGLDQTSSTPTEAPVTPSSEPD